MFPLCSQILAYMRSFLYSVDSEKRERGQAGCVHISSSQLMHHVYSQTNKREKEGREGNTFLGRMNKLFLKYLVFRAQPMAEAIHGDKQRKQLPWAP